ncbi:hypothetical protein BpHYR1_030383 [Brachionus plicatilis]|uniref:Uncharacterized protein n=1 Tax=Brachionus plicatilis TaxID=10195 RepID=A0A3M7SI59_BRAPC|nr:hypothetical protein BpHYR1_030383 [Brachionus plicatilis]
MKTYTYMLPFTGLSVKILNCLHDILSNTTTGIFCNQIDFSYIDHYSYILPYPDHQLIIHSLLASHLKLCLELNYSNLPPCFGTISENDL